MRENKVRSFLKNKVVEYIAKTPQCWLHYLGFDEEKSELHIDQ